ncbi:retrotransposon protein, putative, ty1-copia subclass [Tanacetum coccineum]
MDNLEHLGHAMTQNLVVSLILVSLQKEYDSFVQNYNMQDMGKTINELHAMLKLHEQTLPKKDAPALHVFRAGKVQKKKHKNKKPQLAARGNNHGKGKSKFAYAPKPKIPPPLKKDNPAKDVICHQCGDVGYGTHICITTQGLKGSRKLMPGALSLYVGDGHHAAVEAIGSYHLCLPSGLVLVLYNCHYAPSITRGIISASRLYDDGFINRFDENNTISVSRNNVVYFSDIPRNVFQKEVKNQLWKTLRSLRFDRGGEYMSQEFLDHLKEHRIIAHRTPPYTPQHNGVSERRNRTLLDMVRSMMSQTTLPKSFWDYDLESVTRILNMVWGCEALVKRDTLTKPDKLEPRSIKCIFIGYPKEKIGYSFYYPPENKIFVARNAEFLKNSLMTQEASGSLEDLEIIQEEDTHPSENTSLDHDEDD